MALCNCNQCTGCINLGIAPNACETPGEIPADEKWTWFKHTTFTPEFNIERDASNVCGGTRWDNDGFDETSRSGTGTIEGNIYDESFMLIAHAFLGTLDTTTIGSNFLHCSNESGIECVNKWSVAWQDCLGIHVVTNAIFTNLDIQIDDTGNSTYSASFEGNFPQKDVTGITPAILSEDRFKFINDDDVCLQKGATVAELDAQSIPGDCVCFQEFSISLSQEVVEFRCANKKDPISRDPGTLSLEGNVEVKYDDLSYCDQFANNEKCAMRFTIRNTSADAALTGGTPPQLVFTLPCVTLTSYQPNYEPNEPVTQELGFAAGYDETEGYGIEVCMVNDEDGDIYQP